MTTNELKNPYRPYFQTINELFEKYKKYYASRFISTHADVHYSLDEDGNALFAFKLKIEKSNDPTAHNNNFYVAVPIIKSFNGKCIENGKRPQKIHVTDVKCKKISSIDAENIEPKNTRIQVQTEYNNPIGKSLQLEMWVIPFKLDNGSSENFDLEVSFQVENFAVEISHRILDRILERIGRKKFFILWYFGFVTGASSSEKRIAKIEIEHPVRGQLEIQPKDDRIEVINELGYAKHGRKFICGLHANNNATTNDKSSMHCFFEYSYMPEWAVILLSVIGYHFVVVLFDIIKKPLHWTPFSEILIFIGITFVFGFVLIGYLRKNCT